MLQIMLRLNNENIVIIIQQFFSVTLYDGPSIASTLLKSYCVYVCSATFSRTDNCKSVRKVSKYGKLPKEAISTI